MFFDSSPKKFLSLFSGAGGMDIGLEAAGFENVGVIEIDPIARATLVLNRPSSDLLGDGDILKVSKWLTPQSLQMRPGELDLIAGGPPCQPFSAAAQWANNGRRGMRDPRAGTVDSTLEIFESFLPRVMLMENVLGFVRGKGSALAYMQEQLVAIGERSGVSYTLNWRLLNAADYGVPQNRRRVIIVIHRSNMTWEWPARTHSDVPLTAWDALHDAPKRELPEPRGKWAALLPSIPEGSNYQWLTAQGGGPEVFGYRTKYWNFLLKLSRELPSWTLSASPGPSTGPFHWDNRPLSVVEQLRLQSFPDDWQVVGDLRDATRQVGNATPPLLAEVLGRQLLSALGLPEPQGDFILARPRGSFTPLQSQLQPLPSHYAHLKGPKEAHAGVGLGPASVRRSANTRRTVLT